MTLTGKNKIQTVSPLFSPCFNKLESNSYSCHCWTTSASFNSISCSIISVPPSVIKFISFLIFSLCLQTSDSLCKLNPPLLLTGKSCVFDFTHHKKSIKVKDYLQFLQFPQCQVPKAPCFYDENNLTKNSMNKFLTTKKMAEAKGHEEMITDQKLDSDDNQEEENDIKEKVESSVDEEINNLQELDTDENEDKSSDEIKQPKIKKKKQNPISKYFTRLDAKKNPDKNKTDKSKLSKWSLSKRHSDADTQAYRDGYPGKRDDKTITTNVDFYQGRIQSTPDGGFIDDIHERWWGDYRRLEQHHGYIQWIFPIREEGMNWQAEPLQLHEAKAIMEDKKAMKRVLKSYRMMLDFYGMELIDEKTGKIERAENWKERFNHLSWSFHNYLRITRILKCLGELGLEHLKKPFLQFMLNEALITGALIKVLTSCRDYWVGTLKSDEDREELYRFIETNS